MVDNETKQLDEVTEQSDADQAALTDWENAPTLAELKQDFESAKIDHQSHVLEVNEWLSVLRGDQRIKSKKGRSKIVPKLARKQAEWRYSSLAEPFLSTEDLFVTAPATYEDKKAAEQNGMVLNYQINCRIDKIAFIDEYVRTAVDEGTVIVRVGWEFEEDTRTVYEPIMEQQIVGQDPQTGAAIVEEVKVGEQAVEKKITVKNQPTLEVCDFNNLVIDPTCNGNLDDARFIIYTFETSLAELKKDGRYKNLDDINIESASILSEPDHHINDEGRSFTFEDSARKRIIAKEYWGYWDINNDGLVKPVVATWVGDTLLRMEENPFPDKKLPFVAAQYLPRRKSIYGEPDASLLEDNQRIIGAVTRGIIDIIGRSANGQQGIRKDALDITNARKFENGDDYKFNSHIDPRLAFHMETYPEIPRSALEVLNMQNNEAEALTGIKAFTNGISGQALGSTATGIRSALDATSKRELGILRRLSNGLNAIGRKIISMNAEFLDDNEYIRITNDEFIAIDRNDLGGKYDIKLNISTAESDEQKASELSFMLQTMGNSMPMEMSQLILTDIAKLRKMPELAKRIEDYKPQPDPISQKKAEMELALLQAQIDNETAKAQENYVDVGLKQAKTATEQAKSRGLHSKADKDDLDFVEKESGVSRAHEERMAEENHRRNMEKANHDRLTELDKEAFKQLNTTANTSNPNT